MPAPGFGYSVGDLIAVGQLVWNVYKRCKNAPESFYNITSELLSLHAVLKECEECFPQASEPSERRKRLSVIIGGCKEILEDLEAIVTKYESLGTQQKRTWDRMRWHSNDIGELRARITSHVSMLTAFLSTSQARVEQKLELLLREFKRGNKEGSAISDLTVDTVASEQGMQWKQIRHELEDNGITVEMFNANKDFIFGWILQALMNGAFQEDEPEDDTDSEQFSFKPPYSGSYSDFSYSNVHPKTNTNVIVSKVDTSSRESGQHDKYQTGLLQVPTPDEPKVKQVGLGKMFTVSKTSKEPAEYISRQIANALDFYHIEYHHSSLGDERFRCATIVEDRRKTTPLEFSIYILKMPLFGLHGVEFVAESGPVKMFRNVRRVVLQKLDYLLQL